MKKALSILLALLIALSSFACGAANESRSLPEVQVETTSTPAPTSVPTIAPEDGIKGDGMLHVYLVGDGEKVLTPESSFINYLVYYVDNEHLIICMNGKEYVYANIDAFTWDDFKTAESKGEYFNNTIKGETRYCVADYDGTNGALIVLDYIN